MYRIVALHESINVNSNVFNDIAEAILSRDTLKFHRRVARHLLAMKQRMKTMFSSRPTSFLSSLSSSDDGDIVCIDLDASLNHEENVFKDIVEAVLQRHLTEMKRHEIERDQQKPEHEIHDGTSKNIETKRSRRGFLGRVKDMMTCCTYCIQRAWMKRKHSPRTSPSDSPAEHSVQIQYETFEELWAFTITVVWHWKWNLI